MISGAILISSAFEENISKTIKIGSDDVNNRSKTEIGGDLQVNYNILTNSDEDKDFWTNVTSKQIRAGKNTLELRPANCFKNL